jgi:hypothetical protein
MQPDFMKELKKVLHQALAGQLLYKLQPVNVTTVRIVVKL